MALQIIRTITESRFQDKLEELLPKLDILDSWQQLDRKRQRFTISLLIQAENAQQIIDKLELACGRTSDTHILMLPVSAAISAAEKKHIREEGKKHISRSVAISREELYANVISASKLDGTYLLLILLSTVVAAIGLLENNVAVLIGAMVIAPMLGSNLAMTLATTLGDWPLMIRSLKTNLTGIVICVVLSVIIGFVWPHHLHGHQILMRTDVGYDSLGLAIASGAAAVLSLTTGLSSVLVGVMVAVALLPPLATFGLMLGAGDFYYASGAGLLFAVNIVCINLVANIVFISKGIRPSRWYEKKKAKKAVFFNLLFWATLLIIFGVAIYFRHGLAFLS